MRFSPTRSSFLFVSLLTTTTCVTTWHKNNGLSRTPALGWNNWNSLGCDVSEDLLLDTATKLVDLGLRDVGYRYVVLDDCWSDGRDEKGMIQEDRTRFPNGMTLVADQLHERDLLFGMYSSAGIMTCARYEGSLDHEEEDAQAFAAFKVDYLKYDNCYSHGRAGSAEGTFKRFETMARALNATGRPILYSLCNWGEDFVMSWGTTIANSWRISGDIYDSFARPDVLCSCTDVDPSSPWCVAPGSHCSVLTILNRVAPYADRGQPGGWHDLDMLEVGNGGMTDEEYKAHFALWAALKSPLLIGADIRHLSPEALSILNNPAILAISQDPLGRPARRVARNLDVVTDKYGVGETQVWSGSLAGGDQLVILLNVADTDTVITADMEDIFVDHGPGCSAPQCDETWLVHDLWQARMDTPTAQKLVDKSRSESDAKAILKAVDWYNATATSYRDGLAAGDTRLLGKKVFELAPRESLSKKVKRHSALVYRLRPKSGVEVRRYKTTKDEL